MDYSRCRIISGCSGGGKSTLISALAEKGWVVVSEAGRQIVKSELATSGDALPWQNTLSFVERSVELGLKQTKLALQKKANTAVLSDRSIVDVISYLDYRGIEIPSHLKAILSEIRYATFVFLTPPWRELFNSDEERAKVFEEAVLEYEHLCESYLELGYELIEIPHYSIMQRVEFIGKYLK